jgi:oligopeptide/dipeptide ABC transporter ATP-binding protein
VTENVLEVKNLKTYFFIHAGVVKAVDDVSFAIQRGEILGIVGESGSGKSVTSLSIMRLLHNTTGKTVGGEVLLNGKDLLKLSNEEMRLVRGNNISMIFQEPMTSLNPVYSIGKQISSAILIHQGCTQAVALQRTIEMLNLVGIPNPERRVREYPHQMSGGMRQRVMIAMALANDPTVLICDEPTTALDVTIQAQILRLIKKLCREKGSSILLITHAMGVIAEVADDVIVMYCGKIVEKAPVKTLFAHPLHPYTVGLLESIPRLDVIQDKLISIPGTVPPVLDLPPGCAFKPRCPHAREICEREAPQITLVDGREVRCHQYGTSWQEVKS